MALSYDYFRIDPDGTLWLGATDNIEEVMERIREHSAESQSEFCVVDEKTGEKNMMNDKEAYIQAMWLMFLRAPGRRTAPGEVVDLGEIGATKMKDWERQTPYSPAVKVKMKLGEIAKTVSRKGVEVQILSGPPKMKEPRHLTRR